MTASAACGGPAPVTGARTRWLGMRSPVHKTLCRQRRLQYGDHLAWNAAAFARKYTSRKFAASADEEEQSGDHHSRQPGIRSSRSSVAVRVDRDVAFL